MSDAIDSPARTAPADPETQARQRAEAQYARDHTCRSLGIEVGQVSPGRATARMRIAETMGNAHGIGHGGFVFLLADTAFAYACNTYQAVCLAQSAQISFLRPAAIGEELIAEAVERIRSGRSGIYDVTVRRGDGEVIAEFRGTSQMVSGARAG